MFDYITNDLIHIIISYTPKESILYIATEQIQLDWKKLYKILFNEYHVDVVFTYPNNYNDEWLDGIVNRLNRYDKSIVSSGIHSLSKIDGTLYNNRDGYQSNLDIHMIEEETHDIKDMSCGDGHRLLLKKNGAIKVIGNNIFGQLGLGDTKDRREFEEVKVRTVKDIIKISCSSCHTVLLIKNGTIVGIF